MNIWELFWNLLHNYFVFGWPFFLLHVGVFTLSVSAWWGLLLEIRHLRTWSPGVQSGGSQATQILNQFIAESQALGKQGFLVPITDFSDRLDSIVGGKLAELYERINLFLIVGIAGTLFGVFSFAQEAANVLGNNTIASADRVVRLGETLSRSLANAFPVGFVGLALMFLGQVVASVWENRLKRVVAEATGRALQQREEGVRSQAQIVSDAVDRIERAMTPLSNVHDLLEKTFGPAMDKLEERLDLSLGHMMQQIEHLETTTAGFSSAVEGLQDGVRALERNARNLEELLRQAPEVLSRLSELERSQEKALQSFQANLQTSLEASQQTILALESATQGAQELPHRIVKVAQEALKSISLGISATTATMVDELRSRISADYNVLFQRTDEQIRGLQERLLATSDNLTEHLATNSDKLFAGVQGQAEVLHRLALTFETHLHSSLEASQRTILSFENAGHAAQGLPDRIVTVAQTAVQSVSLEISVATAAMVEELKLRIAADYDLLLQRTDRQIRELQEHLLGASNKLTEHLETNSNTLFGGMRGHAEILQGLIRTFDTHLRSSLEASQRTISALDGMAQVTHELPSQILETARGALQEVSREAATTSSAMAEELRNRISSNYDALFKRVEEHIQLLRESIIETSGSLSNHFTASSDTLFSRAVDQVTAIQELVVKTREQLMEVNAASLGAVAGLQSLRSETKLSMETSFTRMGKESVQLWDGMTDKFGSQTQREFVSFIETIRASATEIRNSLEKAAQSWGEVVLNANTVIKEPIAEVLHNVGAELRKGVHDLDNLMAQRYPEAVRDVAAFTKGLQELLYQVKTAQQTFEDWFKSMDQSRQQIDATHAELLLRLSMPVPSSERSSEVAAMVQERLEQQLLPLQSQLSQLDRTLGEIREQRAPRAWLRWTGKRGRNSSLERSLPEAGSINEGGESDDQLDKQAPQNRWFHWFRRN